MLDLKTINVTETPCSFGPLSQPDSALVCQYMYTILMRSSLSRVLLPQLVPKILTIMVKIDATFPFGQNNIVVT
jgi:hypothetical protein